MHVSNHTPFKIKKIETCRIQEGNDSSGNNCVKECMPVLDEMSSQIQQTANCSVQMVDNR